MQTILGSGGAIGRELAKYLLPYTEDIRLVSRNPEKVNASDTLHPADLTNKEEVNRAVEGSEIVYLTVGFPYRTHIWQKLWPRVIDAVLEACHDHGCKLVFLDNVYMYDPTTVGEIRETNPVNPTSKKGKVRAGVAQKILDSIEKKRVEALIARSADFYGPSIEKVSVLTETVFKPLSERKKASVLVKADRVHSFTYTPDAGKALALLGNTEEAYGEVWHLPTSSEKWTMDDFIQKIAQALDAQPKYQVANKLIVNLIGLFNPTMRELKEMLYQYENDYHFVSEKFEQKFNFQPKTYDEGIAEIIRQDYTK